MLNIAQNIETITESSLDRQARDVQFMMDYIEQNREMERYVNECLILSSGNKRAIQEMTILNEATAGDKIKAFFQKIKDFFKKIFSKLGASLSAAFAEQKKYCEKYAYIITKCKWQAGDVNDINDYFVGIPRIIDMVDQTPDQTLFPNMVSKNLIGDTAKSTTSHDLTNLTNQPKVDEKPDEFKAQVFNEFKASPYWSDKNLTQQNGDNGAINIDKTFRDYFNGSSDTVSYSNDDIESKFQVVINNVYAGQAYLNKLEKIVTSVDKKMDEVSKNAETEVKTLETNLRNAAKQAPQQPQGGGGNELHIKVSENAQDATTKKFKHPSYPSIEGDSVEDVKTKIGNSESGKSIVWESYIYEMNISGGASNNSDTGNTEKGNQKAANSNLSGAGINQTDKAGKTGTAVSQTKVTDNKGAHTVNGDSTSGADDAKITAYIDSVNHNIQASVNAEIQITSSIARAAFGAYKSANSDFFKIIQAHVQWYLSNPGSEKNTENQTTRGRELSLQGNLSVDKQKDTTQTQPAAPAGGGND